MDCQNRDSQETKHSVWRLLLSHHPPQHIGRTLCLRWGRHRWRICARCTGMLLGAATFATFWLSGLRTGLGFSALSGALICLSLPAVIDFNLQLIKRRESTNRRRLITGSLFGIAAVWSIRAALAGQWWAPVLIAAIVVSGFAWLCVSKRRLVRLLQHLNLYSDYFEKCRCQDVRHAARKRVAKA